MLPIPDISSVFDHCICGSLCVRARVCGMSHRSLLQSKQMIGQQSEAAAVKERNEESIVKRVGRRRGEGLSVVTGKGLAMHFVFQ